MPHPPPIAAVEIGTSRTIVMIGEESAHGQTNIVGLGEAPTSGMCKGDLTSLPEVQKSLRAALDDAMKYIDAKITNIVLGISNPSITAVGHDSVINFRESDHVVGTDDLEEVNELAGAFTLPTGCDLMHSFPLRYSLNDQHGIANPLGMRGARLTLKTLALLVAHDRVDNLLQAPASLGLNVDEAVFSGLAVAHAVLTEEQKQRGVAVIDLGAGTTKYVVCEGGAVTAAGVLGVGGDHVTNDLETAFSTNSREAEQMKLKKGSAIIDPSIATERYPLAKNLMQGERTASVRAIQTVTNARMDETFRFIRSDLNDSGALQRIGAGIVLTGGGAHMPRIDELAQQIFGVPAMIGRPVNVNGLDGMGDPVSYATAAGLVIQGIQNQGAEESSGGVGGWFRDLLKR